MPRYLWIAIAALLVTSPVVHVDRRCKSRAEATEFCKSLNLPRGYEHCLKKNLGENDDWCRARAKFNEGCDNRGGATIGMTNEEGAKTCGG